MPVPKDYHADAPKTARERIYMALKEWILDGTMQPGEKISDQQIAGHFSVSRTPVREAFQMLAQEKLIEVYPGRESIVSPVDVKRAKEHYQMLADLHADALLFAFAQLTKEDKRKLEQRNVRMQEAAGRGQADEVLSWDRLFHRVFLERADNYFLTKFVDTLEAQVTRVERLYFDSYPVKDSAADHEKILEALEAGEKEEAAAAVRDNWMRALQVIEQETKKI